MLPNGYRVLRVAALTAGLTMAGIRVGNTPQALPILSFTERVSQAIGQADLKGIKPKYLLTMAILETGYGRGNIYAKTHNLFSIKAKSSYHGKTYFSRDYYRCYPSDLDSINDLVVFFSTQDRYRMVYKYARLSAPGLFFNALQKSGYSESKFYEIRLQRIYRTLERKEAYRRHNKSSCLTGNSHYCIIAKPSLIRGNMELHGSSTSGS